MEQKNTGNKTKISKGFFIALIISLISILNTFFYLEYSQNAISPIFVIWLGIVFSFSVFGIVYSFANSYSESESKYKQLADIIKEQENRFQYLYDITLSSQEDDINKLYEKVLAIGSKSLNLEIGLITKIEGNNYTVLSSNGENQIGGKENILDFAKTCCGITYYANEIIMLDHIKNSLFQNHPCYSRFKIESYVGKTISIEKRRFGTVNFFSLHPRETPFVEADRKFIQLMAEIICITIEHKKWIDKMKANNEEIEWLNKIKIGRELRMIELKREIADFKRTLKSNL